MKAISLVLGSILASSIASAEYVAKANMYDVDLDRRNGNDVVEILEDSQNGERLLTIGLASGNSIGSRSIVIANNQIFRARPTVIAEGSRVRFSLEAGAANGNRNRAFSLIRANQITNESGVSVVTNKTTVRYQGGEFKIIGHSQTTSRVVGNQLIEDTGSINLLVADATNKACSRTASIINQNGSIFDGTIRLGRSSVLAGRLDGKDELFPIYELGPMSLATATSDDLNNLLVACQY